ncbi:MAG TPA: hypothetical protein VIH88_01965 [Candidatus Acidoferrales bacterium]
MNMIRKSVTFLGSITLLALLLVALAPRAARGVAAALVQVTNTSSNPVPVVASDLVNEPFSTMTCAFCDVLISSSGLDIPGPPPATFVVPSTDSAGNAVKLLVIRYVSAVCVLPLVGITATVPANAVNGVTQTFTFVPLQEVNNIGGTETTILAPPGSTVGLFNESSLQTSGCLVTMNGYLAH